MNTQGDARLIAPNEAAYSINANLDTGSIASFPIPEEVALLNNPVLGLDALGSPQSLGAAGVKSFHYQTQEVLISSSEDRFYVEYAGQLYWTNKNGTMKRFDGKDIYNLGSWDAPLINPTVTLNVAKGQLNGDYMYCYTYVYKGLFESPPSPFIEIAGAVNQTINISFTDIPAGNITARILYRVGGINPTFNRIKEIPVSTVAFIDTVADGEVDRSEIVSFQNEPPLDNLDMLVEKRGVFFAAHGRNVHFSQIGTPEYWSAYAYVRLPDMVTGLGVFGDNIIAFTDSNMFMIMGDSVDNIGMVKLAFDVGCSHKRTVKNLNGNLIWYGKINGKGVTCLYNGSEVIDLSKKNPSFDQTSLTNMAYDNFATREVWSDFKILPIGAVTDAKKYYLFFTNRIIVFDFTDGLKTYFLSETYHGAFMKDGEMNVITDRVYATVFPNTTFDQVSTILNSVTVTHSIDQSYVVDLANVSITNTGNLKVLLDFDIMLTGDATITVDYNANLTVSELFKVGIVDEPVEISRINSVISANYDLTIIGSGSKANTVDIKVDGILDGSTNVINGEYGYVLTSITSNGTYTITADEKDINGTVLVSYSVITSIDNRVDKEYFYNKLLPQGASTYRNFVYKTGYFDGGNIAELKSFRKVNITGEGFFETTINIDSQEVIKTTSRTFFLPAGTKGHHAQFIFTSTGYGKVDSFTIEYESIAL